ncbi:MarR family transcriptional regulator [Actinoplanes sp. NPDC026619]|uniref:MarR family winged helix-turn-helix transcriptional regulator n=1 Tax=Actinoplanes sp. NPDC026619 TaxID=3155798 RepID=UPI00340CF080
MLHDRLGYLLKHVQASLTERTGAALTPLGITGRELAVLTVLGGPEPLAQQQAASRLGVDRTTMVDLVDALERKDLVERRPDPADRRRNLVHLTAHGRQVLGDGSRVHAEAERQSLAALDPDEIAQLKALLRRALGEGATAPSPPA